MRSFTVRDQQPLVRAGAATDPGRRRKLNEDAFACRPTLGLFLVADGVGGENAGEVASSMAVLSVANFFEAAGDDDWPDSYRVLLDLTLTPPARRLTAAIRKANADVYEMANKRSKQRNMSSTVVAAHVSAGTNVWHLAHVGDSRCYRLRAGVLERLTRDHSLRNEARLSSPGLSQRQIARIPKNVITRALGRRVPVEIDVQSAEAQVADVYLLCSDGVNRMLNDAQILEALQVADEPREAAELLVSLANEAGGIDNITAVVVQFANGRA